jgi:hypothetical protein
VKTFEIDVPDELAVRLQRAAGEKGVPLDELLLASFEEKLARDEQFEAAADRVLAKNAELYKRLA